MKLYLSPIDKLLSFSWVRPESLVGTSNHTKQYFDLVMLQF